MKTTASLSPLLAALANFRARARAQGWWGAFFHSRVIEESAAGLEATHTRAAAQAYSAEQCDLLAAKDLAAALADNRLDAADLPAVKRALRQITRSAALDHQITQTLA